MTWNYWYWVWCHIAISSSIFFSTFFILLLLLWRFKTLFYSIVDNLFGMQRCVIDAHHQIIRTNDTMKFSVAPINEVVNFATKLEQDAKNVLPSQYRPSKDVKKEDIIQLKNDAQEPGTDIIDWWHKIKHSLDTESDSQKPRNASSDPEYERTVLNVYGKFLHLNSKLTKFLLVVLTTIIIAAALMAAFNSLFLACTSVYRGASCPSFGTMDCYCGSNYTYFQCIAGTDVNFPIDDNSATCFRWIGKDVTTSDVTTHIGVTAGLLVALGNVAACLIRLYLYILQRRLTVANGIYRMMDKTVGVNGATAPTYCCCCYTSCHCTVCHVCQYKRPYLVIIVTIIYLIIPALIVLGIILLYFYRLNVTALTFIVLITFGVLAVLAIIWILKEDNESSANIPGGWHDIERIINSIKVTGAISKK